MLTTKIKLFSKNLETWLPEMRYTENHARWNRLGFASLRFASPPRRGVLPATRASADRAGPVPGRPD